MRFRCLSKIIHSASPCWRRHTSGCYPVTVLFFSQKPPAHVHKTTKVHVSTWVKLIGCSRWICKDVVQSSTPACLPPTLHITTTSSLLFPQHTDQTVLHGQHKTKSKVLFTQRGNRFWFLLLCFDRAVFFFLLFEKTWHRLERFNKNPCGFYLFIFLSSLPTLACQWWWELILDAKLGHSYQGLSSIYNLKSSLSGAGLLSLDFY